MTSPFVDGDDDDDADAPCPVKVPVSNAVARDRARAAGRRAAGGRRGGGGTADWRRGAAGRRARLTNEVASHRHRPPRGVAPVRMIYERCGTHAATARRFIQTPAVHREARVYVLARVRTRAPPPPFGARRVRAVGAAVLPAFVLGLREQPLVLLARRAAAHAARDVRGDGRLPSPPAAFPPPRPRWTLPLLQGALTHHAPHPPCFPGPATTLRWLAHEVGEAPTGPPFGASCESQLTFPPPSAGDGTAAAAACRPQRSTSRLRMLLHYRRPYTLGAMTLLPHALVGAGALVAYLLPSAAARMQVRGGGGGSRRARCGSRTAVT